MKNFTDKVAERNAPSKPKKKPLFKPKDGRTQLAPTLNLSPCAYDYFRALYNPFDLGVSPCIPSGIPLPSQKLKVVSRGTFQVGTTGVGGVAMWPWNMISKDAIYRSNYLGVRPALIMTTSAYDQVDYSFTNAGEVSPIPAAGLQYAYGSNSMYKSADLGGYTAAVTRQICGRSAKLVGGGVRVQYTDQVLKMGGDYIIWRNPDSRYFIPSDQDGIQDLLSLNMASQERISDRWVGVAYHPTLATDLDAVLEPCDPTSTASNPIASRLACGIFIANCDPGVKFHYEAVAYFEIIGGRIPTTASHGDPQAMAAVLAVDTQTIDPDLRRQESRAMGALAKAAKNMGYSGLRMLGGAAGTALKISSNL